MWKLYDNFIKESLNKLCIVLVFIIGLFKTFIKTFTILNLFRIKNSYYN